MSKDHDDKLNPDGLDFTLEEILAEYAVRENHEPEERIPIPMEPAAPQPDSKILPFPGAAPRKAEEALAPEAPPEDAEPVPDEPEPTPEEPEKTPEAPHVPRHLRAGGRRLFRPAPPPEEPAPEPADAEPAPEEPEKAPVRRGGKRLAAEPKEPEKVVPFPQPEKGLKGRLHRLRDRADGFAEHMFEEEGTEDSPEVRRAERYIPGVDEEEPEEERPPRRKRRPPPRPPICRPRSSFAGTAGG